MNYEQEMYYHVNPEILKINQQVVRRLDQQDYENLYYKERNELPPRLRIDLVISSNAVENIT